MHPDICGFPIVSKHTGETLAYCNKEVGHDDKCSWTLSRERALSGEEVSEEHDDAR